MANSFLDAQCTQQIALTVVDDDCAVRPDYAVGGFDTLADVTGLAQTWGRYALDDDGKCVADVTGPPGGTTEQRYYTLDNARAFDFARVRDEVE